ncbi:MAG: NAD(P)/FAD-dependent oxidoreductase [Methanomicrobiales archaeon]|nr:NAD(P)/FAD-dependent oxidoreductase [Methanomicrobiales archaeon]
MELCIVGGGLCGLTAAAALSEVAQVDLIEKQPLLGGCLSSYHFETYTIERYYHHFFSGDHHLIDLMNRLGMGHTLEWLKGTTGYYVNGTIYPLSTPLEILRYPYLSLLDKARLALLTLNARRMDTVALDGMTAEQFVVERYGRNLYRSFFEPLLASKFGELKGTVSAAWLVSRIAIRSNRGMKGERLGYLNGGFEELIQRLSKKATKSSCTITTGTAVTEVQREGDGWRVNGNHYNQVLFTIPPQEVAHLTGLDFPSIPYQGAACLTLGLDREVTKGIYWLNMKDAAPYGAVVSHTSFVPRERYGESIIYLASYFTEFPPHNLEERMIEEFCRQFDVARDEIHWHRMAIDRSAGPVYTAGYRDMMTAYYQHGLYLAGMFSEPNYPERSMEGSVRAAENVTALIRGSMGYDTN